MGEAWLVRLRFTLPAARQLERVLAYITAQSPQGVRHVQERIQAITNLLLDHPLAGQETSRPGMRRMFASPYPYVIFYRASESEIVIHGLRHTARRPIR